ncbi:hypothetical protein CkaCkLH20_00551 [Colletotrichum karsti]|uniref:Uncharacterized protein n=1 Tax=Colletotrichum karsti TaxID=1095194 RepID=A0A9P6IGM6_9PEZI|nr:uncharacterized protein CkaCkLH20_00551 [Colletotrichum karsti]KAF9882515.1 hypothetical protein CkaCkLH20_00551 [Colletotrichum karsti]
MFPKTPAPSGYAALYRAAAANPKKPTQNTEDGRYKPEGTKNHSDQATKKTEKNDQGVDAKAAGWNVQETPARFKMNHFSIR